MCFYCVHYSCLRQNFLTDKTTLKTDFDVLLIFIKFLKTMSDYGSGSVITMSQGPQCCRYQQWSFHYYKLRLGDIRWKKVHFSFYKNYETHFSNFKYITLPRVLIYSIKWVQDTKYHTHNTHVPHSSEILIFYCKEMYYSPGYILYPLFPLRGFRSRVGRKFFSRKNVNFR